MREEIEAKSSLLIYDRVQEQPVSYSLAMLAWVTDLTGQTRSFPPPSEQASCSPSCDGTRGLESSPQTQSSRRE